MAKIIILILALLFACAAFAFAIYATKRAGTYKFGRRIL